MPQEKGKEKSTEVPVPSVAEQTFREVFRGNFRLAIADVMNLVNAPASKLPSQQEAEKKFDDAMKNAKTPGAMMQNLASAAMDTCGIPKGKQGQYETQVNAILGKWQKDAESLAAFSAKIQSQAAEAAVAEKWEKDNAFGAYCHAFGEGFQRIAAVMEKADPSFVMPAISNDQIAAIESGSMVSRRPHMEGVNADEMKRITNNVLALLKIDATKLAAHPTVEAEVKGIIEKTVELAYAELSDASGGKYTSISEVKARGPS